MEYDVGPLKNAKHERFCQERAKGATQLDAYVTAGYSPGGAKQGAAKVSKRADVTQRIADLLAEKATIEVEATRQAVEQTGISKAWVLRHLAENVLMAKQAEPVRDEQGEAVGEYKQNLPAANKALELIGKELGMFTDTLKIGGDDKSPIRVEHSVTDYAALRAMADAKRNAG